jgi:hypothetical protein
MLPLTALYARVRRDDVRRRGTDVLLLFALLCALRCLLDPWDNSYYPLPFLLALLTWEALRFTRPPLISLLATFAAWLAGAPTPSPGGRRRRYGVMRRSAWPATRRASG